MDKLIKELLKTTLKKNNFPVIDDFLYIDRFDPVADSYSDTGSAYHLTYFHPGIGYYSFVLDTKRSLCYRDDIHVDPDMRGCGHGTRLVKMREELCSQLGIKKIVVHDVIVEDFWSQPELSYRPLGQEDKKNLISELPKLRFINTPLYKNLAQERPVEEG